MNNLQDRDPIKNEIDIIEIFSFLWDKKYYIFTITLSCTLLSIYYALSLPNIYTSEAEMLPVDEKGKMSGALSQYSSMASLAGISLPTESVSKSQEAMARIESFDFFSNHFLPSILLEDLLAVKNWNHETNNLTYEEEIFNSESREWVRKVSYPQSKIPSSQEAYEKYLKILRITENKKTSFVTLSIEHFSPFIAKQWVELIIDQIDEVMRNQDKIQATRSIEYLNSLSISVSNEEIKNTFAKLKQEQMKQLMMVEANDNYVFNVLDSPLAPEIRSEPNRVVITILGTILGIFLSIFISLVLYLRRV